MIPWTVAHQAPLSMGFSRQEYWSGFPFPSPGDLPGQESNPGLPYCRQILYHLSHQGSPSSKESTCQCRRHKRHSSIPGSGRSPAGGHGNPSQYYCLENPYGQKSLAVHRVTKCWTGLKQLKGFPGGSDSKEAACNAEDSGLIPGLGRSPGERNGNLLQHPCLENSMDREAWWATVHGVAKSWAQLSDCKEIQPVHPKKNPSLMFIGRTDVEAETPILWLPDVKSCSFEKTLMLGKIEGRRRRR